MQKVNELKRPLKLGKYYLVPVFYEVNDEYWEVIPYIDYPHSDKENGQNLKHYHTEDRFVPISDNVRLHRTIFTRLPLDVEKYYSSGVELKRGYVIMKCIRTRVLSVTPTEYIYKSKLKHQCIHKGKCPHRGYDLTHEPVIDGVITCPLHGLKFDGVDKKLLNKPTHELGFARNQTF